MGVIKKFIYGNKNEGYDFHCPGCKSVHSVFIKQGPIKKNILGKIIKGQEIPLWKFNGDEKYPTFKPSILVRWDEGEQNIKKVCHSFITMGYIRFLGDCTHKLKNQTIKLSNF